jgi:hypothetical protein
VWKPATDYWEHGLDVCMQKKEILSMMKQFVSIWLCKPADLTPHSKQHESSAPDLIVGGMVKLRGADEFPDV